MPYLLAAEGMNVMSYILMISKGNVFSSAYLISFTILIRMQSIYMVMWILLVLPNDMKLKAIEKTKDAIRNRRLMNDRTETQLLSSFIPTRAFFFIIASSSSWPKKKKRKKNLILK